MFRMELYVIEGWLIERISLPAMCGSRPGPDGQIAGVVALAPGDEPGALDLNKLFIEPRHIRSGVGRALLARRRVADDPG